MFRVFIRYLSCIFVLLSAIAAFAQNAHIAGQITDQQNAAIPNAEIRVTNLDTAVTIAVTSDDSGNYTVPFLTAGPYRIIVQARDFSQSVANVSLGMGQALLYSVQLTVGQSQSTVNVNANNSLTEIHTENSEISGTITGKEVAGIQLNGRNFSQFIALAPGVSNQTSQDEARVGMAGSVSYSVNGGRTEYNSFQVDGSEVLNVGVNKDHTALIVTPSIDAIQEIKVLTSNYGAMYPSTGNGTTIITTKSGSDQYHGNLYEFIRNEMFNAKGYFDAGNRAPLYRRNDFGGTIGGPLSIPHIYDAKGRTHFFFSEEVRLEKDPYAYRQAVPSLAERNGDFSDACPSVANGISTFFSRTRYPDCPDSGLADSVNQTAPYTFINNQLNYPGNTGPNLGGTISLNQNARALLGNGIFPLPNASSGCNSTGSACFIGDVSLPTYWREELFRIDQTLTSKQQLSFRYIHDEWDETTPVPQYAYTQNSFPTILNRFYAPGISLVARLSGAFSSTLLNEFVASYTDSHITLHDLPGNGVSLARPATLDQPCASDSTQCGMTQIFDNGAKGIDGVPKMPGVSIAGNNSEYGGLGFATDPGYLPWNHTNPIYSFADNIDKMLGRHNLQFGAQMIISQRNQTNGPIGAATGDTQGLLTFSDIPEIGSTGNSFADFLYNYSNVPSTPPGGASPISSYQQDSAQSRYRQRYKIVEPYFQDDFKVSPRLTLNLGIRLSLFGTYHEIDGQAWNWESLAFNPVVAQQVMVGGASGADLVYRDTGNPVSIYQSDGSVNPLLLNGSVQCAGNGRSTGCLSGHLFNPAPRVGFAWDPTGRGKLALRGGYGIFFEHGTADEANTGSLEGSAPVVLSMTQVRPAGWGSIGMDQFANAAYAYEKTAFPINVTAIPVKAVWPYVQQWSASVEQELPRNMLASVAYVGSKGTHLTAEVESNQLAPLPASQNPFGANEPFIIEGTNPNVPGGSNAGDCAQPTVGNPSYVLINGQVISPGMPGFANLEAACIGNGAGGAANALRTFAPGIGEIYSLENVANSNYNALQVTLRRVQGPLALGAAYTYSHSFDNSSDRSDATFVNSFDLRANRASSNFDQRHLLHISYIYDLPLIHVFDTFLHFLDSDPTNEAAHPSGQTGSEVSWADLSSVKAIFGGWQWSGLTLFETGIPFTVVNNGSPSGIGTLDNAGVANGVGSGSYPDLSGLSPHSRVPAGGKNGKSFGPLLLNPEAFIAPRGLTFGNAGRNSLNNPDRWNWDMALLKHFTVSEHINAEFRAEAFNIFNNTQFRIYDPTLGNQAQNEVSCYGGNVAYYSAAGGDGTDCLTGSSFLHPVDAHRPRTMQFALKLSF
jgi:Carboxypeptidase regulatory-like domain